jgi:hypothetical protein
MIAHFAQPVEMLEENESWESAILKVGRNSSFFILNFSLLVAEAPRKGGRRKKEKCSCSVPN